MVNYFEIDLPVGVMIVWQMKSEPSVEIGQIPVGFEGIFNTHENQTRENRSYNNYTMVNDKSTEEIQNVVKYMNQACFSNYSILTTEKKTIRGLAYIFMESDS